MTRSELADAVNAYLWETRRRRYSLDSDAIKRYEGGKVGWPNEAYREALRSVLDVRTDAELGFRPTPRGSNSASSALALPAATPDLCGQPDLGVSPTEFLARTSVETPIPRQIGWTDVEHVRATTRAVATSENLFGGGLSCEAAIAQLRWAVRLIEARADNDVRMAMFEAVGNLSGVVAYSAFDIANYGAADRCFKFALWCSDQAGSWTLRANTLAEMSRKSAYIGNLGDALTQIEFAQVRSDRVSRTACAMLWAIRARLLVLTDRLGEAVADVGRADAYFADRDAAADPPWLCYYDEAEHLGSTGKALIPIARKRSNIELAAPRLETAIRLQGSNYPRSRTFSRTRLAALMMSVGDPREAASIGQQAVADAAPLRSRRIMKELASLAMVAERYARIGDVAELRHDITSLTLAES